MRTVLIAAASLLFLGSSTDPFPQCEHGLEPRLATVKHGDSDHQLVEALVIECSDGGPLTLFARGARLPASYEDNFFADKEDAEEIHLYFPGLGLFASRKLHKGPGGLPHMKATIRVDEKGQVTLTEWDPDEEVAVEIGSIQVEKEGGQ